MRLKSLNPISLQSNASWLLQNPSKCTALTSLCISQRIASGGDGEKVKFFGQSVHGEMDLNGDGLIDVTIGGLGGAALFWYGDSQQLSGHEKNFCLRYQCNLHA